MTTAELVLLSMIAVNSIMNGVWLAIIAANVKSGGRNR
jgi:hypothetical protein